jgi:hypothetical protein
LGQIFESPGLFASLGAPGVLIALLVLVTPALIRTRIASSRQRAAGAPPSGPAAAVATFLSSLGVIALIGLASVAAFYATCFAVCMGGLMVEDLNHGKSYGWIMVASVGAGLVPGLWVAVRLCRRFWTRKGRA